MENYPAPAQKQVIDGEWARPFIFIAGRLCIDFTQTGGETPAVRAKYESLHGPADLTLWLTICPLEIAGVAVSEEAFRDALDLREAIWRAAQAIRQGPGPAEEDIAVINRAASVPDIAPGVSADGSVTGWQGPLTGPAALSMIARDAIALFSGDLRERIRECENPTCALLFVDSSRPGLRRWCHMDRCGNRFKTAAYRRRKKSDQ